MEIFFQKPPREGSKLYYCRSEMCAAGNMLEGLYQKKHHSISYNGSIMFMVEPFYRNMEFQSIGMLQQNRNYLEIKRVFSCLLYEIKTDLYLKCFH